MVNQLLTVAINPVVPADFSAGNRTARKNVITANYSTLVGFLTGAIPFLVKAGDGNHPITIAKSH